MIGGAAVPPAAAWHVMCRRGAWPHPALFPSRSASVHCSSLHPTSSPTTQWQCECAAAKEGLLPEVFGCAGPGVEHSSAQVATAGCCCSAITGLMLTAVIIQQPLDRLMFSKTPCGLTMYCVKGCCTQCEGASLPSGFDIPSSSKTRKTFSLQDARILTHPCLLCLPHAWLPLPLAQWYVAAAVLH